MGGGLGGKNAPTRPTPPVGLGGKIAPARPTVMVFMTSTAKPKWSNTLVALMYVCTEIAPLTGVETNDNVHHVYSLAICAALSFLRQQAVHFEFRSVSLFRAVHPFWSGTSSSRAATNCVERSFSPARLPKVLHESFFGRVQASTTRAGGIHTYALSPWFLKFQSRPPLLAQLPGLLAHFQKWQAFASSHFSSTPVCVAM